MIVIMKTQTIFNNKVLKPFEQVEISDNVGSRWCKLNIATPLIVDNVDKNIIKKVESFDSSEVDNNGLSSLCGSGRLSGLSRDSSGKLADGRNKTTKKSK